MIGTTHPLYPNYKSVSSERYDGKLVSCPLNNNALDEFPPRFKFKGTVFVGDKIVNSFNSDITDFADRHQLPITIKIDEAVKYLGNVIDIFQCEADELVGKSIVRKPREFAPPHPFNIKINDEIIYDYLELGLVEILDDETLVITNDKQTNPPVKIKLEFNANSKIMKFNISRTDYSNINALRFSKVVKSSIDNEKLSINSLKLDAPLLSVYLPKHEYKTSFKSIEQEVDFLERICELEEFTIGTIRLPNILSKEDFDTVFYVTDILRGEVIKLKFDDFKTFVPNNNKLRDFLYNSPNEKYEYDCSGITTFDFFDIKIDLPILMIIKNAYVKNIEKIKALIDLMEEDEDIPIVFVSDDNFYTLQLAPKEFLEEQENIL